MLRSKLPCFWHWLMAILLIEAPVVHSRPEKPTKRYTRWSASTPTVRSVAIGLGYNEGTWNAFQATIESNRYSKLPFASLNDINFLMDYSDEEEKWNCWINHYQDYSWSGLDSEVRKNWEALGYDELRWTGVKVPPAARSKSWSSLTEEELAAAENLCYESFTWSNNPQLPGGGSGDSPACFSGVNGVQVQDRGWIEMEQLRIGDYVMVSGGQFSRVYSFSHFDPSLEVEYRQIFVENFPEPIEISAEHMIFVNGQMTPAGEVKEGDILGDFRVQRIDTIVRRGAYAPVTESGDIVVTGILASSYVAILDHSPINQHFATHAFLSPLRLLCTMDFGICENETYTDGYSSWVYYMMKATQFVNTHGPLVQTLVSLAAFGVLAVLYVIVELLLMPSIPFGLCIGAGILIWWRWSLHSRALGY